MEVLAVLGFDDEELVFEAPVPAVSMTAAYWRAGDNADGVTGPFWPVREADAEALVGEVPGGLCWFLEAVAE